jgi:hypothetical protein
MGIQSSLRRTPLSRTRADHVRVVDAGARADYLLRTWPDPRLFRRAWSHDEWFEFEPPWMDVRAWARDEVTWTVHRVRRRARRSRAAPLQYDLGLPDVGPQVVPGDFGDFVRSIPESVADSIAGFRHDQYRLLRLLAEHPPARDLVEANPALTVCLTDLDAFCGKRVYEKRRRIEELLAMRQRDALQWLGFAGTDSTRKILRKLRRESVSVYLLLQLRGALGEPMAATLLRHCPSIHRGSLALVADPDCRPRVTPSLLREVSTSDDELIQPRTATLVREIASLQRVLGFEATLRAASRTDARRLHDELTEQYLRLGIRHQREREERERERHFQEEARQEEAHQAELEARRAAERAARRRANEDPTPRRPRRRRPPVADVRFPDPPIEGPPPESPLRVDPVRTRAELGAWAERQQNCCASSRYVRRLAEGSLAIYRLRLGKDEATLSLARTRGRWMREEFKAPRNRSPSKEMRFVVGRWLQQRGVWIPSGWVR